MRKMVIMIAMVIILVSSCVLVCSAGSDDQADYREYIEKVCADRYICQELVEAVIERESNWDPKAKNGNCIGLMQIDQTVHWLRMQNLGVTDLTDPYENILVGVSILSDLYKKYKDNYAVLMLYNAGYSGRYGYGAYLRGEFSDYAIEVLERAAELERLHGK